MGFSWSSAICQEVCLNACVAVGLTYDKNMGYGRPSPLDMEESSAVATDDIMVFQRCSRSDGLRRIDLLDAALADNGVMVHEGTSESGA